MDSLLAVEKEIDKALDAFDVFYNEIDNKIDKVIETISDNVNELNRKASTSQPAVKSSLTNSVQVNKEKVKEFIKQYSDKHKDLHANISKIGKAIDKNFIADFGNLPQTNIIDTHEKEVMLHQVISEHLMRNGHIDISESLIKEANLNESMFDLKKKPFIKINYILGKIKEKDVQPALEWCYQNSDQLKEKKLPLEFNLHRLNFIQLLKKGAAKQNEALAYARNFTPFAYECQKEIQRLMGSMAYVRSGLENSPYNHYLGPELWNEIEDEFLKNACQLIGLSTECPLSICAYAGCKALPSLINIVQVMQQTQVGHILSKDELPIEIDLGQNHRYHSVFACPILRQQSTDLNPPMKLVCGHVISKDALNKLNSTGKLKCPYCPMEQTPGDARQIFF
jgi:hypothetical protein